MVFAWHLRHYQFLRGHAHEELLRSQAGVHSQLWPMSLPNTTVPHSRSNPLGARVVDGSQHETHYDDSEHQPNDDLAGVAALADGHLVTLPVPIRRPTMLSKHRPIMLGWLRSILGRPKARHRLTRAERRADEKRRKRPHGPRPPKRPDDHSDHRLAGQASRRSPAFLTPLSGFTRRRRHSPRSYHPPSEVRISGLPHRYRAGANANSSPGRAGSKQTCIPGSSSRLHVRLPRRAFGVSSSCPM